MFLLIRVFVKSHTELCSASGLSLGVNTLGKGIKNIIKNCKTAPFDSCFPNRNQTQNSLDFCDWEKAMTEKRGDGAVPEQCLRESSLAPFISWFSTWDNGQAEGTFPRKT